MKMDKGKKVVMSENGSAFDHIDRSQVKILLCEIDLESCGEVFTLLRKCSYQVTSVWTATEMVNTLNTEGPNIDIILADISHLVANGARVLKYVMGNKELQHIPVIMLLTENEIPTIGKCLKLGVTSFLMKPLSIDELVSMSFHTQRRQMAPSA